jgi:hypothetical protein
MHEGENLSTEVLSLRGGIRRLMGVGGGGGGGGHDSFFHSSFGIIRHSSPTNSNALSCAWFGLYPLVSDAVSSKFSTTPIYLYPFFLFDYCLNNDLL